MSCTRSLNLREMVQLCSVITVLCFLHCNVAPAASATIPDLEPSTANSTMVSNSIANMMDLVSKKITDTVNNIADPVWQEVVLSISREFTRFTLRLEFFTIAAGGHLAVPEQEENVDKEYHEIAAATTELWQRLNIMERVEEILTNATGDALKNSENILLDFNQTEVQKMTTLLKFMFEKVDTMLRKDSELQPKYLEVRNRIKKSSTAYGHKTYLKEKPKSTEEENKVFKEWFSVPKIKKFLVNKMFLIQCTKQPILNSSREDYNRYILGRALLTLAKEASKRKRVQRAYYEAVKRTSEKLVSNPQNDQMYNGFLGELSQFSQDILTVLFSGLEKQVTRDPVIKADLKAMKKQLKKSGGKHPYQVDYWPL